MTWQQNTMARVTAKLTSAGGEAVQNVFHVRLTTSDAPNAGAAVALGEWLEDVYTNLLSYLSEEMTFQSYNILLLATSEALGDYAWPTLTTGGATGDQLPASNCCLSLFKTGYSRIVGRKYWGPFSEAGQDNGIWIQAVVDACQDAALAAATSFTTTIGRGLIGVVHNFDAGAGIEAAQVATTSLVRTQRRRNRGIGI